MSASSSAAIWRRVLPAGSRGRTVASRTRNWAADFHRRAAGDQLQKQPVHPVQRLRPGGGQLVTAVTQQPQHGEVRIGAEFAQPLVAQRDHDDRMSVGGVGLAALAGIKHSGPSGQFRWDIQHPLAAGQQPLRQRPADPIGAFHRPYPLGPLPGIGQQLPVAARVSAEPALGPQDLPAVPGLDRH